MKPSDFGKTFLGVGWAFPLRVDSARALATAAFEEDIRQAIIIIIETGTGERVMRPDFGAGLREVVFEPVNRTTIALVKHRVEQALREWEPRIDVDEVKVTPREPDRLIIDVTYRVRITNAVQNLVYPFYIREGQGA